MKASPDNCFYLTVEIAREIHAEAIARFGGSDGVREMALLGRKLPMEQFFTMPPEMLFVNRLQFGFYSVLARLDVDCDYASVERAFIPPA